MTTRTRSRSPNVFAKLRRKLRRGRSYDLSAQTADDNERVCLRGVNDLPTSYDRPGINNANGDTINIVPHLNGIHGGITATLGSRKNSTPVSSPLRYIGSRNIIRDENHGTVDKVLYYSSGKVSCEDVNSPKVTPAKTRRSRTNIDASSRDDHQDSHSPRKTVPPVVEPPRMTVIKVVAAKETMAVNTNCACPKPQDDNDIGGYSLCKDIGGMELRRDDVRNNKIQPKDNTGWKEETYARPLDNVTSSRNDPIDAEPARTNHKNSSCTVDNDNVSHYHCETFDISPVARSRQMCSSINSTGTVTSGESENSTAESGEEADYTIVGDIEVQVPEDVATAYQSPSRKSRVTTTDARPKVKTTKAITKKTDEDVLNSNVSCGSSKRVASQLVLASDIDEIFVTIDRRVYRQTTEHRPTFSQLYASVPKGPIKSPVSHDSTDLVEEDGTDDSSGIMTSPDEPRETDECEDLIPPLPSRNYTIREGDDNYNAKMMRSISSTSASSATSTEDEPTHMSWAEVMKEAQTLGIPLRTPSRETDDKSPNSQSMSSMDTSCSSIDTTDGCISPGTGKRPERRRDKAKVKLPVLVVKTGNVSITDVHAELTADLHRRTLPPPLRSPKSASPKTSTLGRPRFHSSGHLTHQEVRGSQSRHSLQSMDSGVGQSRSSVSLDTGMSKARHGTSRETVPTTNQGVPAVCESGGTIKTGNVTDIISSLSQLKECGWYWGPLSWDDAEAKLAEKADGSFLVRDSSDDRYILSLTFRSQGTTHHTRIEHYKGMFSFYSQPKSHGESTIVEFIEKAMAHSRSGRFLYFLRPRAPGLPPAPIQLLTPVSRFQTVHSLQHACRFAILKCVRRDHIMALPVPLRLKEYLQQSQYYTENFGSDDYGRQYH